MPSPDLLAKTLCMNSTNALPKLLSLVILVFVTGTLGYMLIEDWNFLDSLFMTVTTLTTVGYGEVHPLGTTGKLFTCVLILSGVSIAAYAFSKIVSLVVEGELAKKRIKRRMEKELTRLKDHVIVCGYGRLGKIISKEIVEAKQRVVVIDTNDHTHISASESGVLFIQGSAYEDENLKLAGVEHAKVLITMLPSDAENVYVTLCARDLNPNLKIIARTEDEGGESRLKRAGASQVVAPYRLSGNKIVQQIIRPYVSDFLELAGSGTKTNLFIEEVVVPSESKLVGKTLEQSELRAKTGAIIAAFISTEGKMTFNPTGKDIIEAGSTMIVLGEPASLGKITAVL